MGHSFQPAMRVWLSLIILFTSFKEAPAQATWKEGVLHYINEKLAKSDGGYGWEGQPDSHLTPTFAVIGILHDLDQLPDDRVPLIDFVRTHHPQHGLNKEAGPSGAEVRTLVYQQIQGILWLEGDIAAFKDEVRNWKSQAGKIANYEKQGYPVLMQEMMTPVCRHLLNIPLSDFASLLTYLQARRRKNGSFNNAPAKDGGDGNMLNTYWSIYALNIFDKNDLLRKETATWIQSSQLKNGGFTHQPHPVIGTNDDVAYTWAAVKALQLLSATPKNRKECIRYLISLKNPDGGFGNQPGLPSTPISTFYAIDALKALGAFSYLDTLRFTDQSDQKQPADFSGLKVFAAQFEASGTGSPSEAVMLADSLGIQLWGAKNADSGWVEAAQKIADEKNVPVTFFHANEPYGKYVHVEGMGSFSHITDYISSAKSGAFPMADSSSWQQFRKDFVQPLLHADGGLILQISNNEPLARMLLDESVKNGGYAAISTVHFGQNFLFFLPYLYQYRYQLPFIALQDAHGIESWWWANELAGYRTLFLAKEPTYQEMMKALKNNWVVTVRHDSVSSYKTRMLGGAPGVHEFVSSREDEWKWWNEETNELNRPWAAMTIVESTDSFEIAHPDKGVNIRIRCWWDGKRQMLKEPLVELDQLLIDNKTVEPEYIQKKDKKGKVTDAWYLYAMPHISEGEHMVEATLRYLKNNSVKKVRKKFTYMK